MSSDSSSLGEAVLDLVADGSQLEKDIDGAKSKTLNALNELSDVGSAIFKTSLLVIGAGVAAVGKGLYDSVQAAQGSELVWEQLNATLKSTGGVAGVTADQVMELADALSQETMFDDEAIVSAESLLLTFTNIGKNVFPDATQTVLDMSQALGQDLKSSSIQLGKALQDPILGVSALRKVGVNFTDAQKDMIEQLVNSGKLEEAQAMILKELQTEFGGSAKAAGKTFAGQLKILQTRLGNIQEKIGGALLPALDALLQMFNDYLSRPDVQAFIVDLEQAIVDFSTAVVDYIPTVIQTIKNMFDWLMNNKGIIVGVLAAMGAALAAFAYTSLVAALPVIAIMAAIGAAAYLLYTAWTENWGGIQEKVAAVWAWLEPILMQLWNWLQVNVPLAIQELSQYWQTVLLPAIQAVWAWMQANLFPLLANLWNWLATNVPAAIQTLANYWKNTLYPAILWVWSWMNQVLFPFFQALGSFLNTVFGVALTALAGIWKNVLYPALREVYGILATQLMPIFKALSDWWNSTGSPVAQAIAHWFGDVIVQSFRDLTRQFQDVTRWLQDITNKLNSMHLPSWMTPGSPTPWEIGLWGIDDALQAVSGISLPSLSANLGAMPAPALSTGSVMAGMSTGGAVQFVYSPMISTADEYEARRVLGPFIDERMRQARKQ